MINFFSENIFALSNASAYETWIKNVLQSENYDLGELNYIFCDDEYLIEVNLNYLNHDTYTDIITFDNTVGMLLSADIYISTERVEENAKVFEVSFDEELKRVMIHGILHCCGYNDHTDAEKKAMRLKEEEKIKMFHVEQ